MQPQPRAMPASSGATKGEAAASASAVAAAGGDGAKITVFTVDKGVELAGLVERGGLDSGPYERRLPDGRGGPRRAC